ncbi:MAG: stage III sporulation protein AE [Cellulosilyticum sp.]|nr:stage III sporulation protein AE [Cellulosilyticum sp.]MEE1072607.1 stage III sporulation protein AE [Cellulosilyticum sp.]
MKKRKKIVWYSLIILVTCLTFGMNVEAQTIEEVEIGKDTVSEEDVMQYGVNLFDWDSIEALQNELSSAMPEDVSFDLKTAMEKMIKGEAKFSVNTIIEYILKLLFNEISVFIQLGARFVLIVLLCNLLQTLSSSFKSKNTSKVAFFVCYMTILLSVVQSFRVMIELAITVIDQMTRLMLVCIPMLLAFMATSGFNITAGSMAPVIVSALNLMTYLIKVIVLPCTISVVVLEIVSSMSEEFKVNKLVGTFYKWIKWGLRTILGASVGLLGLYRLIMPGVDTTLKQATVKFSSAFIPVVGNAVGGTIDFIAKCSSLIKNGFAAGVMIWILILISIPLIKIFVYACVYQVAGAVIEPLGDKKMAAIATKLAKGCQFIMSSVGIIALFCICALVICMSITSNGV